MKNMLILIVLSVSISAPAAFAGEVRMKVGQTKHITAYRGGTCNAGAPTWQRVKNMIPKSSLVEYSDGGLSSRVSDQCKKRVPTRAVNGKAVKPGKQSMRYQSGPVTIIVE